MKLHILLFILVFSFSVSGQAKRKPVSTTANKPVPKVSPSPPTETTVEIKQPVVEPAQKVVILKINGDKISGFFVGGDTEKITINFSGSTITVKLSEIQSLNFNETQTTSASEPIANPTPMATPQQTSEQSNAAAIDFNAKPRVEVSLEDASLFPDNYANRIVDFKRVWIGDIEFRQIGGDQFYSLWVESPRGRASTTVINAGDVNFIMTQDLAKSLSNYYASKGRTEYNKIGANITVAFARTAFNNQMFTFALVRCIELISYQGAVISRIGSCN